MTLLTLPGCYQFIERFAVGSCSVLTKLTIGLLIKEWLRSHFMGVVMLYDWRKDIASARFFTVHKL